MRRGVVLAGLSLTGLLAVGTVFSKRLQALELPPTANREELSRQYQAEIRPLLARYCLDCHSGADAKAKLDLAGFQQLGFSTEHIATWKRVVDIVQAREMPPSGEPRPTDKERERLIAWLLGVFSAPEPGQLPDPGHVIARRLNQVEYNNTLFDLLGFNKPASYFDPQRDGGMPKQVRIVAHRDYEPILADLPPDDVGYGFDNIGEILSLPPFLMEKYLASARQVVALAMTTEPPRRGDVRYRSNLFGSLRRAGPNVSRETVEDFVAVFLRRAFRRPVEDDEVERYMRLFDAAQEAGLPLEKSVAASVQAVLVSPHFLFRIEAGDPSREEQGVRPLTDYELATRLSYFLWSSMPDEELFRLAGSGQLRNPDVLESQARRMLRSRKAKELAENFALQWMQVRDVQGLMPDPERFPAFYRRYLGHAMRQEALMLFETILAEDRSVLELIDPGYTWLNGTLASFYGLYPEVAAERNSSLYWRRYELDDPRRGGIIAMGATLAATSTSTRTSPVKRGKWILETILGFPPPPPLDNVPDLDSTPAAEDGVALKEKLQRHRADPACAGCHQRMDPLGLGLENYDAIGAWRDREGPLPIEAAGTLTDGSSFHGPAELKTLVLEKRRDDFLRCLTSHMLTYALGRKLEPYDLPTVYQIADRLAEDDYRLSRLVVEIVRSYPFNYLKTPEVPHE